MPVDVKKWLRENMSALNASEEELAVAEKLLDNPKFKGDFVPLSDFHSQLDRQRNDLTQKYQRQVDELTDYNLQWQDKYETEYGPALAALQRLQAAGGNTQGLSVNRGGEVVNQRGQVVSLEQIEDAIQRYVEPVRAGTLDYATFVAEKAVDYSQEFSGKRFSASKFREFAFENRSKYPTLEAAYDAYTAEDRKAKQEEDRKAWEKRREEEIRLEVLSSTNLPEMAGGEGGAPAFAANNAGDDNRDATRQEFAKKWGNTDFTVTTAK